MSERLEELYERARAMGAETRASFLAEACGGDFRLERELTSLLAHADSAESFFAGLAGAVVSPAVGHRVGHYRLVGILGTGGMGTVYRAHDTRLERVVALKFLPPHLSVDLEARKRFLMEARAAAALDHPNVCSIHEIGDTADGRPFIAMACYEGETLKQRLTRGPLPPAEAMDVAVQLARGLRSAHARGIVHRDVKPGNIMLCGDGTVRLLDFGVAKLADMTITGPGTTPGTIAYMSPEQARGDPVNHLTDLWSLGVVLYEMLSGARPFRGGNDRATIQAILHEQPKPLPGPVRRASPSLPGIVERLLRKVPEERCQSADELLLELARGAPARGADDVFGWMRTRARPLALSGAALLAAITLLSLARPVHRASSLTPTDPAAQVPTIAVLPFTVRGPGLEVWREGMVDLLSMGLDGAAGIRAIDSRTLLARWHQDVGDEVVADLKRALGVARRTGARYALVGSAVGAGPRIRLGADVYDVASGRAVGPLQVEGPSDSVLALVDRLGMQTVGLVLEKNAGEIPALDLAGVTTRSLIALKAYLEGEGHYRRSEFREASEAWERAVRADTVFALAYLGLADAYAWSTDYNFTGTEKFRESLERARRMADRLPARERARVQIRWAREVGASEVVPAIREIVRNYPDAADAWYQLGEVYYHDAVAMGKPHQAEEAFRRAAELQPTMAPYRAHLLDLAFLWHPDSALIAREVEAYTRVAPGDARARAGRIALALAFGDTAAAARAGAGLAALDPNSATQVYLYLAHPRFAEVREAVFSAIAPRLDRYYRAIIRLPRFLNLALMDGRPRSALRSVDDSSSRSGIWYCGPLYLSQRGLPVPERVFEQRLAASRADSSWFSNRYAVVCAAGYAARQAAWTEHGALVSRARAIAARELAAGDSSSGRMWESAARAADGFGLWQRGRKEEALRAFEGALPGDDGWGTLWHVGQLALELGRVDQAERAFRALWKQDGTAACLQLARILERTGRRAEAREAYQFVADAWQHADPELQSAVEEARQAVTRLSPLTVRSTLRP